MNLRRLDLVLLAVAVITVVLVGLFYFIYRSEDSAFSNFLLWYASATGNGGDPKPQLLANPQVATVGHRSKRGIKTTDKSWLASATKDEA